MRTEYDFSKLKRRKIKVTINLDPSVVRYFKKKAEETGIGYQTLINDALRRIVERDELFEEIKNRLLSDPNFIENLGLRLRERQAAS